MNISTGTYVEVHYTVRNTQGEVVDSSEGGDPLAYIQGVGQMIPGFEKAVEGLAVGAEATFDVVAAEAYGERNDQLVRKAERNLFPDDVELEPGMQFEAQFPDGPRVVTLTEVGPEFVTLDANHPMAGHDLNFSVRIMVVDTPE